MSRTPSQASSCSSTASSFSWRWDQVGPTGVSPLQTLCALPVPVREKVRCGEAWAYVGVGWGVRVGAWP